MHWLILVSLFFSLAFVLYQDVRYRAVYWFIFPVVFVLSFVYLRTELSITDWGINFAFIVLQLAVLWGYFSLKHGKVTNYINSYLGLGDVLFFFVLILWFTPVNFILFFIGSLILILLGVALLKSKSLTTFHIPLAGIHSALLIVILLLNETILPGILTTNWINL